MQNANSLGISQRPAIGDEEGSGDERSVARTGSSLGACRSANRAAHAAGQAAPNVRASGAGADERFSCGVQHDDVVSDG